MDGHSVEPSADPAATHRVDAVGPSGGSAIDPSGSPAVRQLAERVESRLAELDSCPVSAHGDVYAAIHAELSQALERLDA